jgi:hypothetical protein
MPPTLREPRPNLHDTRPLPRPSAGSASTAGPGAAPTPAGRRTPPPGAGQQRPGPASARRLLRQRLVVFVTVTAGVALAIAAAQGCENRHSQGLGVTPGAVPPPATHPAQPAAVPGSAGGPAANGGLSANGGLVASTMAQDGALAGVDWADRRYPDPGDGSTVLLRGGRSVPATTTATGPGPAVPSAPAPGPAASSAAAGTRTGTASATAVPPVTLTAVLPARYRGAPAAVVVLTRRDGTVPEDLVELFGLPTDGGAEPVLLASHASTGDPQGTGSWRIADGAVLREEHTAASGPLLASTTRYTPLANGTMTESWPGTGTVAGQQG